MERKIGTFGLADFFTEQRRKRPNFLDALPKWEGDQIFLDLLWRDAPFFLLKLRYHGDRLVEAVLDGKRIK